MSTPYKIAKLELIYQNVPMADVKRAVEANRQAAEKTGNLATGALIIAGVAALLYALTRGGEGTYSSGNSSGTNVYDHELEHQMRQNQQEQPKPYEPPPRSYGLYGDCPAPGMGYGC